MKVLMLTSSYPLPEDPTWGPFVRTLARGVQEEGHDVRVLVFSPGRQARRFTEEYGVEVVSYKYTRFDRPRLHDAAGLVPSVRRSWLSRLQIPSYVVSSIRTLLREAADFRPDLVHAHWLVPGGWIAHRALKRKPLPLVTTAWGADLYLPRRWPIPGLLRRVERASHRIVAVSEHLRRRASLYGLGADRIRVIPNAVDTQVFRPSQEGRRSSGTLVLGTARRLVPEKRVEDLLDAMSSVSSDAPGRLELRIVGEGPERPRLEKKAAALGIEDRVRFVGAVPHTRMPAVYQEMDLFLNPSVQEGMATANLEAMASGVPVLGYQGVGNDEVVTHGRDGFLVTAGRSEGIAEVLRELLDHPAVLDEMGRTARATAESKFSMKAVGTAYAAVYREAVEGAAIR